MKTISLQEHLERVRARKRELGIVETPELVDAMRSKGELRTPAKRELLRRVEERAKAAGVTPMISYY
jgi:hypothetical protein